MLAGAIAIASCIRIGHKSLGRWGGYSYVDFVAPWRR